MDLVERYLNTVKSGLPVPERDDIVRELSEDIYAEIGDKEKELGRRLEENEIKGVLMRHGHPLGVARQFRRDERSLAFGKQIIGPNLFPFYLKVLWFNLGLTALVILVIFTALMASGQQLGIAGIFSTFFWNLLLQFAIITGIFAGIDRQMTKHPDRWDIAKPDRTRLPNLTLRDEGQQVSRMSSISRIVALMVSLVWLRAVGTYQFLILGPSALFIRLAPVWHQLYGPLLLICGVLMVQSVLNVMRPDWVRLPALARAITGVMGMVLYYFLFRAGVWVVTIEGATAGFVRAAAITNQVIFYCLIVGVVANLVTLVRDVRNVVGGISRAAMAGKVAANS